MALLRKGFHWSGWLIGWLVCLIFVWVGWSPPPWAEAARYRGHTDFNEKGAIRQGRLFDEQLAEETSRLMVAQTGPRKRSDINLQDTAPPVKQRQPQQTLKVETMKPDKKIQPQQAFTKVETPQPSQAFTKVESLQSKQPGQIKKGESRQPAQAMKVE